MNLDIDLGEHARIGAQELGIDVQHDPVVVDRPAEAALLQGRAGHGGPGTDRHAPGRAAGQERRKEEEKRCQPAQAETSNPTDIWWVGPELYHNTYE